jgi:hypothetical protein
MNITWYLPKKYIFILYILSNFAFSASGQITLLASSVNTSPNNTIFVDITGNSKDSLASISFSLAWDSLVLKFQGVDNYGFTDINSESFNLAKTGSGQLAFLWANSVGEGIVLKENQRIFRMQFTSIGNSGTKTTIQFKDVPTKIRVYDYRVNQVATETKDGMVNIGTSAVGDITDTEGTITLYQNTPNPAKDFTIIPFRLKEPDTILLQIFDIQGREVFNKKDKYTAGKHEIRLSTEGVYFNGTYIYSLTGSRGKVSRTMVIKN